MRKFHRRSQLLKQRGDDSGNPNWICLHFLRVSCSRYWANLELLLIINNITANSAASLFKGELIRSYCKAVLGISSPFLELQVSSTSTTGQAPSFALRSK